MENKNLTLGSLFDGSGGFPLGGIISGVTPIWSSEIEPFPIRVTEKRLPSVTHFGDISKINGAEIPPVDIITFGSPCQDMSIAGRREGLDGERSGLFYQAIRIIKEMREATNGKYPRYAVWENVKGAFSSNKGEDFRQVLEEFLHVTEPDISVPRCEKWKNAGCILGESSSVAWRLFDAQFWGVPQRRERIYAVADFTDTRAGDILFVSEGLSGYSAEGFRSWQRAANGLKEGFGETGCLCLNDQGGAVMGVSEDKTATLRAEAHGHQPVIALEHHPNDSRIKIEDGDAIQTLSGRMGTGGGNVPLIMTPQGKPMTLKIRSGCAGGGKGALIQEDKSATLAAHNDQTLFQPTAFGICSKGSNSMMSDNPNSGFYEAETSRCLDANGGNPSCNQGGIAVIAIEGNGQRPSHKGDGYKESDVMYTLNTVEQHSVAFAEKSATLSAGDGPKGPSSQQLGNPEENFVAEPSYGLDRASFNQGKNAKFGFCVNEEVEPAMVSKGPNAVGHPYHSSKNSYHTNFSDEGIVDTLVATDYKDPPTVSEDPYYIVRRLTPTECARLQGFPDWWTDGLASEEPSDEEVEHWLDIFETQRTALGLETKPKTENQIRKWLKDPYSDSAAYKMWGNGVALPCVVFVLSGIVYYAQ
ncbi:MAG: DNA (cytosine-5-)-methyltransferase [Butyrivibrio sp.]|nr:DNA (cytosine-5-)-methyltransferase [Butyrivibrio sp.]